MKVYFITRFSIFDPEFRGFRLTTDYDQIEYKRRLFDKNRLNHKFDVFQKITMPSIVEQSCDDWKWLIFTSDRLPDEYMKRLRAMVKNCTSIVLITVRDFSDFFEKTSTYNYEKSYATVRIDDDDGLNNCFTMKLQKYSKNVGSIVCFTEGTLVKYNEDRVLIGDKISEINNAQGLAGIGVNIYSTGRHSDIDSRYNVIYDSTPNMYLLSCSPFTDTNRGFTSWERLLVKIKRLLFIINNRPGELPREFVKFIQKRFYH